MSSVAWLMAVVWLFLCSSWKSCCTWELLNLFALRMMFLVNSCMHILKGPSIRLFRPLSCPCKLLPAAKTARKAECGKIHSRPLSKLRFARPSRSQSERSKTSFPQTFFSSFARAKTFQNERGRSEGTGAREKHVPPRGWNCPELHSKGGGNIVPSTPNPLRGQSVPNLATVDLLLLGTGGQADRLVCFPSRSSLSGFLLPASEGRGARAEVRRDSVGDWACAVCGARIRRRQKGKRLLLPLGKGDDHGDPPQRRRLRALGTRR